MVRRIVVVVAAMLVGAASTRAAPPSTAPATAPATQDARPWPIAYRHETRDQPRLHLHIVTIDLTDPRVELVALPCGPDPDGERGPWQMTLATVRQTASDAQLDVAVNANFFVAHRTIPVMGRRVPYFGGNWARAVGWFVSDGKVISRQVGQASLVVYEDGRVSIGRFAHLPRDARHVVSGSQQILTDGRLTARDVVERGKPARAPRTAVGITGDRSTLVMLVVDGRLITHSLGMSETELAREMLRLGCTDAINLDGGGSSTLVVRDPAEGAVNLMSRPSDGHDLAFPLSVERAVACVIGARVLQGEPQSDK